MAMTMTKEEYVIDDEVEEVHTLRKESSEHQDKWRHEAREAFEFRDGNQWDSEDVARLEEQQRPVVTFNRCAPIIDSVVGYEQGNRTEVRYLPRTMADRTPNQIFTEAARWVRDQCDAEDEESDAYADAVTCGMGWTETRVDFEEEPDGKIIIERVAPLDMRWDPHARKHNLADARWVLREKYLPLSEIRDMWPDKADEIQPMLDSVGLESDWLEAHDATEAWKYDQDQEWVDPKSGKVLLLHYQWKERETYYRVQDFDGQVIEVSESKFSRMREFVDGRGLPYSQQRRWLYMERFIAGMTLLEEKPCPIEDGFSYQCVTAKRDEEAGYWYGMMRAMRDPQEWANKFFSQTMHILNSNAKGGLLAEEGAVDDKRAFEDEWARPDAVSWVEDGALSSGKIQQKDFGGYPGALDKLLAFAISSIRDCTGVNLELMGMANREQAGVLEQERKKAALVILAPMINSLRRYRKMQGRVLLSFMREYIAPGTVMRLTDKKTVQFWDDDDTVKYDVIVDTAPTSPNLKEEIWAVLQNIVPAMVKAGVPLPPDLIRYSPLPESVADDWIEYIEKQTQGLSPEQQQKLQERMEKLMQENQQLKAGTEQHQLTIQQKKEQAMLDAFLASEKVKAEMQIADADRAVKLLDISAKYEAEAKEIESEFSLKRATEQQKLAMQQAMDEEKLRFEAVKAQIQLEATREKARQQAETTEAVKSAGAEAKIGQMVSALLQELKGIKEQIEQNEEESEKRRETVLSILRAKGGELAEAADRIN